MQIRCVFVPYSDYIPDSSGSEHLHGEWRILDEHGWQIGVLENNNDKECRDVIIDVDQNKNVDMSKFVMIGGNMSRKDIRKKLAEHSKTHATITDGYTFTNPPKPR